MVKFTLNKQIGNHIIVTSNLFLHCFMIIFHLQKGTNGKIHNKLGSYRNNSLLSNIEGSHRQTIRILVWHWFWVPPLRYTIQTWNRTQSTRHQCFLQTQHIPWKTRYHMVICLGTWKWYKKCLYSALGQHIIWLHCIFYCLNFFNSHILVGSAIFTLLQCSITGHTKFLHKLRINYGWKVLLQHLLFHE